MNEDGEAGAASHSPPEAVGLLDQLATHVPYSGMVLVAGALDDEMMRPLDFAPSPGQPARALLAPDVIDRPGVACLGPMPPALRSLRGLARRTR
jgi:hypothetical protein